MNKITIDEYCKKPKGSFRKFIKDQESNEIKENIARSIARMLFSKAMIKNFEISIVEEIAAKCLDKYRVTDKG